MASPMSTARRAIIETVTDYDPFAVAYNEHNESSPWNALYERPATLAMVGDIDGLDVLDAGCGSGVLAAELVARGATVTGLDLSTALLDIARQRLGDDVPLHHADLAEPLPFGSVTFDLVVASLVLHYLREWKLVLAEFHRVLRPGGRVVLSTHHPFMASIAGRTTNYFETYLTTAEWDIGEDKVKVEFWCRPLSAMVAAFLGAGFEIAQVVEPDPDPRVAEIDPDAFRKLTTEPWFLFVELRRV
jgi:SAM-dependent methyltransferase